jgi:hypothetical protein
MVDEHLIMNKTVDQEIQPRGGVANIAYHTYKRTSILIVFSAGLPPSCLKDIQDSLVRG